MASNLEVVISATDRFTGTANRVIGSLGKMEGAAGRVGKGVGQLGLGLARVAIVGATAAAGGLVAVAKAGLDFQDAMAGVSKTVEGTPDQIAEIGRQLLAISTTIPVTATDLADIAQELGALNVPRADIANTARVVAELSAATVGLTTAAAAEAFGKLGNVLNVHGKDVERFGSSLVALGNAGASSEGDIIQVATRFGAAGHAAGLTAAQILGVSSAVASLGVQPEAAGGALSRLFNNMTTNLALGNSKAKAFGKTLGLTAGEAKKAFGKDALGTFETFLQKLAGMDKFEQAKVLKAAGITNSRDVNALRIMSQQYAEVKRQVDLSSQAWTDNTALQETAAKRFDSVKAKLTVLANTLRMGAIVMANEFLPALGRSVTKLTEFLKLPSTENDLKSLGREVAAAIDGIDWGQVADGVRTFGGLLKDAATILSKIPVQIDAAVVAFLGLNKISGGLIGAGIGNIVGGLAGGAARGIASKVPGIGSVFAQPVYVTNWPGGIGGLGGAGGTDAAGGGMGLLAGGLALGAVGAAEVLIAGEFGKWLRTQVTGSDAPLGSDHVIAQFGPVQFGVFQSQAQSLHQLVTLQKLQSPHPQQDADENAAHARNNAQAPSIGTAKTHAHLQKINTSLEDQRHQMLAKFQSGINTSDTRTKSAVVSAIRASRPIVNLDVRVSGGQTVTIVKRYQSGGKVSTGIGGGRDLDT